MKKFILVLSIFVFMLFGFSFANAEMMPEASCVINGNLKIGSSGEEVICLQTSLGLTADGKFGKGTRAAVKEWQKAFGLKADGVFGAKSRALWLANGSISGNTLKVTIDSPSVLPNANLNASYTFNPEASGGVKNFSTDNYTWSLSSGALPPGLNIIEGLYINGVPRQMGTYNFSLSASNGKHSQTKKFTLTVVGELPTIDSAASSTGAN